MKLVKLGTVTNYFAQKPGTVTGFPLTHTPFPDSREWRTGNRAKLPAMRCREIGDQRRKLLTVPSFGETHGNV